ncbi:MAG TPA: AraC family transcriptional regulator [Stackebrandtia sp.]|jgi:AraC-like DNA-binding protein|uniref:AraC family transcriptional regulator n=1 Tax=Stackebrandtia sp. TaxID=2023065 RepID=UPI002D39D61B|nr:AraC family transcriptional regulator [Stackebrandtia sp.]HZE39241.1 AraC family transcriptional regulator [Stackebrandtia sp.]
MPGRTITIHYVNAALRGARQRGVDVRVLLEAAGIPPGLCEDARARVATDQFTRLIQALWEALDDEMMGFGPVASKRGTFAMMCHATIHCRDLGAALRRGVAFYGLFPASPELRLERADGVARVKVDVGAVEDPDRFLTESLLVIWHGFASWAIGRRIRLDGVELAYPRPPHAGDYEGMFGCAVRFGQPRTALSFPERYLDMPILQDEASLKVFLRDSPADLLSRRDYDTTVGDQVRRILTHGLRDTLPGLEQVAARLAVSPQTLRRRLAEEHTAFRQIKDQVRRDAAIAGLAGSESVEDLGRRLGFSEASAFHRAFRRWTGATPGSYRRKALAWHFRAGFASGAVMGTMSVWVAS